MSGFEGQWGLPRGEPEDCRKKTPLLKGAHKILYDLSPGTEAVGSQRVGHDRATELRLRSLFPLLFAYALPPAYNIDRVSLLPS